MKKLTGLALLMLTGCAMNNKPQPQTPEKAPPGFVKILQDDKITSYIDFRVISTYQGNSHLRRFYFIDNYAQQTKIIDNPPLYIASSRAIYVINCDKNQRSVMGRTFFSKPRRTCSCECRNRAVGIIPGELSYRNNRWDDVPNSS